MGSVRPRALAEYLSLIWHRKLLIILIAAIVLKAAFTIIDKLPEIYESRAALVVTARPSDDPQVIGTQIVAVTQQVKSRVWLEPLIRRHQLSRPGEGIDDTVGRLSREIRLETRLREYYPQAPESVSIAWRNSDPKLAQQVVTDLVAIFNEANDSLRAEAVSEAARISSQIAEIEGPLGQLSKQRAAARSPRTSERGVDDPATSRPALATSVDTLSDKQFALERQIAEQKQQIADQQKLVSAAPSAARSSGAYGVLLTRKAELEALLKDYATQYTEKNTKVIQARNQLAEIERQIAQLDTGSAAGGSAPSAATPELRELRSFQRELSRMETELEVTKRELERKKQMLAALPASAPAQNSAAANTAGGSDLEAEYDRLSKRYVWLMERQDALQKIQAKGAGAALFQTIDPPFLPQSPVAPNRRLLRLLALALALGLALLVVTLLELPRLFLIWNERDIDYYLGAPVLGLIPETLTPLEHSRARRQKAAWALGVGLLALTLLPALVILLDRLQIFHLLANR
jgi:uncharacterized protein involved in exopolysaccharide biosynthesis